MRLLVQVCLLSALVLVVGCARNRAVRPPMPPPASTPATATEPAKAPTTAVTTAPVTAPAPAVAPSAHAEPQPAPVPDKAPLIITPDTQTHGKVAFLNPDKRYVIVSFPIGALPPVDHPMNVYRNGLKVGEIKITGPKRDFNIVADIVAGECQIGDEVR
jgi:hypothetical protein